MYFFIKIKNKRKIKWYKERINDQIYNVFNKALDKINKVILDNYFKYKYR
jgi:hypothetical protein